MTTKQYVRVFARFWPLVIAGGLLGWAATVVFAQANLTTYESSSSVLVIGTAQSQTAPGDAYQATLLAQQRMTTYAELANNQVAKDISNDANLDVSTSELASRIVVSVPEGSSLLRVVVSDTDPDRARQLAARAAVETATLVNELERPRSASGTPPTLLRAQAILPASQPVRDTPPIWRNPVLGVAAGVLLGMALAVIASQLDRRVVDSATVETRLGSTPVVVVPRGRRRRGPGRKQDARGPAVSELRTVLFFQQPARKQGLSIALTSPDPIAELPELASDLATSLNAVGARVLVVQADLRSVPSPSVSDVGSEEAWEEAPPGLSTHLSRTPSSGELIQPDLTAGYDVVPAGPPTGSATALLHSHAFVEFLEDAESHYDFILVVAPAMSVGTDALAVAAHCGHALLVIKREHTRTDQLEATRARLLSVDTTLVATVLLA